MAKTGDLVPPFAGISPTKYDILAFGRAELDLTKPIREQLKGVEFDLLINAAAATNVDWCEQHPDEASLINARSVSELGSALRRKRCSMFARQHRLRFRRIGFSSLS